MAISKVQRIRIRCKYCGYIALSEEDFAEHTASCEEAISHADENEGLLDNDEQIEQ